MTGRGKRKYRPKWIAQRAGIHRAVSRWIQWYSYTHAETVLAWLTEAGCAIDGRPIRLDEVQAALSPSTGQGAAPLPDAEIERECRAADLERRSRAWMEDKIRSERNALYASDYI